MPAVYLDQITAVWNSLSKFVHVLHSEQDYEQAVELLDSLIEQDEDTHVTEITKI